mmetsp:Transcript_40626/g.108998  ORF Transcript_40626/g.108998 Transcript_40626/m.108998 type:complete len:224 (-) Transcript_40626:536-1207(-)
MYLTTRLAKRTTFALRQREGDMLGHRRLPHDAPARPRDASDAPVERCHVEQVTRTLVRILSPDPPVHRRVPVLLVDDAIRVQHRRDVAVAAPRQDHDVGLREVRPGVHGRMRCQLLVLVGVHCHIAGVPQVEVALVGVFVDIGEHVHVGVRQYMPDLVDLVQVPGVRRPPVVVRAEPLHVAPADVHGHSRPAVLRKKRRVARDSGAHGSEVADEILGDVLLDL